LNLTPRRWRTLLWMLMVAGVLFAVRPLTSRFAPETLFLHSDKLSHVLFFGFLWLLARRAGFAAAWPLALTLLGYGVFIEVAQALSPTGRAASLSDVAADSVGIALAWWFTTRRRSAREPEKNSG
jgi:VanZ family protein